jgi:hypothetical protein
MQTEAVLKSKKKNPEKKKSNLFLLVSTSKLCVPNSILVVTMFIDGETSSN